jgi:glutathione peroxidase
MTPRQIFLKLVYPLIMLRNKVFPHDKSVQHNSKHVKAPVSFHAVKATANNGDPIDLNIFRGKKILLVNTASNCGFTPQYAELETLYNTYRDSLVVIGFPANDFKEQEQLDDTGIAEFCKINFGVTFPLAQKSQVIKGQAQTPVFSWLTHADQNGWCNQQPLWNFCKYLVDEQGDLMGFFAHSVSPLDTKLVELVKK